MQTIRLAIVFGSATLLIAVAALAGEPAKTTSSPAPIIPVQTTDPFIKGDGLTPQTKSSAPSKPPLQALFVQEVYTLKLEDALKVLEGTTSASDRYQRVLALEHDSKARLLTLTALTTKSGFKATTQSIDAVRYASAFRAPTDAMPKDAVLPTNFEIRNAGDTWEMETIIEASGATRTINFSSKHVGLLGFTGCTTWPGDPVVEQPRFTQQSLETSVAFRLDEPVFLGTYTPPNPNGFSKGDDAEETSLAFLRVHLLPVEAAAREQGAAKTPASPGLTVQYSLYSLDRHLARDVVHAGPGPEAPWEKLQGILREKQAKLEHVFAIAVQSGRKGTGGETDDVLYGTQYRPPQYYYPTGSGEPASSAEKKPAAVLSESARTKIAGTTEEVEVRHAGLSFELEPVLSPDGTMVDLIHILGLATYLGNLDTKTLPAQPLFESRKFATGLTVEINKHVLTATFNPPSPDGVNGRSKDDGRTTLIFLRVTPAQP